MLATIQDLLAKYGMNFLNGLGTTLLLALISVSIGCIFGALLAIMRLSRSKILGTIATVYTEVIRDTPLLLQLYFFYFLLPDLLPALKLSKFTCMQWLWSSTPARTCPKSSALAFSPSTGARPKLPARWACPLPRP